MSRQATKGACGNTHRVTSTTKNQEKDTTTSLNPPHCQRTETTAFTLLLVKLTLFLPEKTLIKLYFVGEFLYLYSCTQKTQVVARRVLKPLISAKPPHGLASAFALLAFYVIQFKFLRTYYNKQTNNQSILRELDINLINKSILLIKI